jgi:hypothetical protein
LSQASETTGGSLQALLAAEQRTVLLVFWARWHVRSNELAEHAQSLAAAHAGELVTFCVDVDKDPDVAMAFGMRALPLCLLYRNGQEVARAASAACACELNAWLWRNGVVRSAMPADFPLKFRTFDRGAFHADPAFKEKVCTALKEKAQLGFVRTARIPNWNGRFGSITGALAGAMRPEVVEAECGLPFSFVCALEFLCTDWDVALVDALLTPIPPGADLKHVATQLIYRVFADAATDWRALLDDSELDVQRQRWLRAIERHLAGVPVVQQEWDEILVGLGMLRQVGRDPQRSVQDCVIDLLGILSPPPSHDDDLWVNALSLHGIYIEYILISHELDWAREDFAFEGIRAQWFMAREALEPGGKFTPTRLALAQNDWLAEMGEEQARYDELLEEARRNLPLVTRRIRSHLQALIEQSAERCHA